MPIHISKGNSKIGNIPSLSFPPHDTCAADVPCHRLCYAWRVSRSRPTVCAAWQRNLDLWNADPLQFRKEFQQTLRETPARYFRYFVAGDIPDVGFYNLMYWMAKEFPDIKFMAYTKRWREYSFKRKRWSDNIVVRASTWPTDGWRDPPKDMPWAEMLPKDAVRRDETTIICPGECGPCHHQCWNRDVNISIRQH